MKAIVTSNMYVILAFLDLVRPGTEKKIVHITSNSGDVEFTRITGLASVVGYSAAKAAMNVVMAKFAAELAPEGIKSLSLAPGWVATDAGMFLSTPIKVRPLATDVKTAEQVTGDPEVRKWILGAFHKVDPSVTGPIPVGESVASQLEVIKGLTAETSGKFVGRKGLENDWF